MIQKYFFCYCSLLALSVLLTYCNKKEYLDEKPDTSLLIPATLEDLRALLDNDAVMSETPVLGELSADNYYINNINFYQSLRPKEKNAYVWAPDIYNDEGAVGDWNKPYEQVFYANVVLEKLHAMPSSTQNTKNWNELKGAACFIRAFAFHNLAQVFCPAYDQNISPVENSLGIPLRLASDITKRYERATVQDTYNQIRTDLQIATELLPNEVPTNHRNRPSKPAAYALLARVKMDMRQYDSALYFANQSLNLYNILLNYNGATFDLKNPELLYQSYLLSSTNVLRAFVTPCIVDSTLYRSYAANDLRRTAYYLGNPQAPNLKIGYSAIVFMFSGLATDELYCIKAECLARTGNFNEGINVINQLLEKRWINGSFIPLTATDSTDAMTKILAERRKELAFRGLRWSDIRRFNKENANITLTRTLNSVNYSLAPDDSKYILPIPPDVIRLSGISPNPSRD